jgi:DNA-binding winged helix-turn-helix (wHTH) protein/tetratricopeptide (TPR) repeat protein
MSSRTYRFGDFTLSTLARELSRAAAPIALSPRAFDCLVHLIENRDRAVGKDELITAIWGRPNVSDTQLGQTVLRARRAVGDDGQVQHFIRTVSRYGYRWIADVEIVDPGEAAAVASRSAVPLSTDAAAGPHVGAQQSSATILLSASIDRRRRWRAPVFAIALLVIATLSGAFALQRFAHRQDAPAAASAIVLPLRVDGGTDNAWLRLGGMDLIAERLRAGGLAVPPSESVVALLQTAKDADEAATTRALREAAPTALLIRGAISRRADSWVVELHATTTDGARLDIDSLQPDALSAAREAAERLLGRLGRAHTPEPPLADRVQERLQRAQAAMLSNDLDDARAILIGDPLLVREEPQLGYRLAQVDFRAGEYARAEASLGALLAEPAANDPLFRARLLNGRGALRIRLDDYAGAEQDYDTAVSLLRDHGRPPELGVALTGRGITRSMRRMFGPALADFGEARVQLESAGDALAVARVDSNLGGLEMNRDRPEQALAYLESAATQFERYGAINELMETLESLVSDNLALLRPSDALVASDRSWALAPRVTDANQRLNLNLDRVDVFLALGRLHEASALLAALPEDAPDANPFLARRLPALRARLALAEGRAADAAATARRALGLRAPGDDDGEGVAEIALLLQRATLAASPLPAQPPAQAWVPLQANSVYPVQALLKAEWADAQGDDAESARLFRNALDLAERRGVPTDVALVTTSYGPWLLRHGREREAGEVIGRVSPWAHRDFDCALLDVRLFNALHQPDAWSKALAQATALAGERAIPDELRRQRH